MANQSEIVEHYIREFWAKEAGQRLRSQIKASGLTMTWVAAESGTSASILYRIFSGAIIPRDYLRYSLAHTLRVDAKTIWPPLDAKQVEALISAAAV